MMALKAVKLYLLQVLMLVVLVGCSAGTSEETDNQVSTDAAKLQLFIKDINGNQVTNITSGNTLSLEAVLTDSSNQAIENQEVNFSASSGTLSASSRLTDSNGQASITYDSTSVTPGVITIDLNVTYQDETLTISSQFEVLSVVEEDEAILTITFKKDGDSTNRVQVGESAQLGVELKSQSGNAITNTVINFTAELGTLSASTALTDASGVAEVSITGVVDQLGAALATASATINNQIVTDSLAYEVVDSETIDSNADIQLGYLDGDGVFQEGIKSTLTNSNATSTISAGGTLGIEVVVYDKTAEAIFTESALTINFSSACSLANNATLDSSVTTINGSASATFEDVSCATAFGNEDTIIATASVNGTDITASHDIVLEAEGLGSIEFVSATPESIVLRGTGGQGKQESSTLTFIVKGELGNPLAQQTVEFELNTEIGGLALVSSSGITNSEGQVSAKVTSGSVPTAVRVTASVTNGNESIATQSDLLSVNTGLPEQNSFSLALSEDNPEAFSRIAIVQVSAYLADSFNNPVPDGTTVNFTAESGSIGPSCNTVNGTCMVEWRSQGTRPDDHRVTILATSIGHETFVDLNGNNLFDENDGAPVDDSSVSSGLGRNNISSGFIDMSEAWVDNNENGVFDSGEQIIDFNNDNDIEPADPDGKFNGAQCEGTVCSNESIHVRKAAVLITSSSEALYSVVQTAIDTIHATSSSETTIPIEIARNDRVTLNISVSDTANQTMPNGTTVTINAGSAVLIGESQITIQSNNNSGGLSQTITLVNEVESAVTELFLLTIQTPSGETTSAAIELRLQ